MSLKVPQKINAELRFLYRQSRYLPLRIEDYYVIRWFSRILIMDVPHGFSFKEKFKTQTSKKSKQIYSFLPKFTSEISYGSIAL